MFVGKDGNKTLDQCLVHAHALCVVLLLRLPCLAYDVVGNIGADIVVWSHLLDMSVALDIGQEILGVVLPHVVWDYQEEPVEVTEVGDM